MKPIPIVKAAMYGGLATVNCFCAVMNYTNYMVMKAQPKSAELTDQVLDIIRSAAEKNSLGGLLSQTAATVLFTGLALSEIAKIKKE